MSEVEFISFCEEIIHDDNLQEKVKQISNPSELIQVGKEKDLNFTVEDISVGLRELIAKKKRSHDFLKNTEGGLLGIEEGVGGLDYLSEQILNLAK